MGKHALYADSDVLDSIVAEYVKNQPWYKKNANTITTTVGTLSVIASGLVTSGLDLPPWAITLATAIAGVGTILGVKKTKNGVQSDLSSKLQSGID